MYFIRFSLLLFPCILSFLVAVGIASPQFPSLGERSLPLLCRCVCSLVFISSYMWPEGPWQLPYTLFRFSLIIIPFRCHPQQPTGYRAVLVGLPLLLLPTVRTSGEKRSEDIEWLRSGNSGVIGFLTKKRSFP